MTEFRFYLIRQPRLPSFIIVVFPKETLEEALERTGLDKGVIEHINPKSMRESLPGWFGKGIVKGRAHRQCLVYCQKSQRVRRAIGRVCGNIIDFFGVERPLYDV